MEESVPDDLHFLNEEVDSFILQDRRRGGSGPRKEWRV